MAAMENWDRNYKLVAGKSKSTHGFSVGNTKDSDGENIHISFTVEKSDTSSPNSARVELWNLSPDHLKILQKKNCVVSLKAGYGTRLNHVLLGTVSSAVTIRDNADRKTEIEVVDGLNAIKDTRLSTSHKGKVNCKTLYNEIAQKMGVSVVYAKGLKFKTLKKGFSYAGKASKCLSKLVKYSKHKWTIQNGVLQITSSSHALSSQGYILSADTGLIGDIKEITIQSGKSEKSGYEIEFLMNAAIGVNDIVKIQSKKINGNYRVRKITIQGDNYEGDWICTAEVLKYKTPKAKTKKKSAAKKKGNPRKTKAKTTKK